MTRRHRLVLVAGSVASVTALTARPSAAGVPPAVTYRPGATITAHLVGERPGYRCQIAARDIDGPWQVVDSAGVADLDSGAVPPGAHRVRVICEDPARGDVSTHVVGAATVMVTV